MWPWVLMLPASPHSEHVLLLLLETPLNFTAKEWSHYMIWGWKLLNDSTRFFLFFFFPWAILSAKLWQTSHEVWHLKQNTTHCSSTKKVQVLKKFKRKKNLCILVEFLYLQWFWSMLGTLCLLSLICQLNILSMRKKKPKTCCETCQGFLVLTYKYLRWHR